MPKIEKLNYNCSHEELVDRINEIIDLVPLDCSCAAETQKEILEGIGQLKPAVANIEQTLSSNGIN